MAPTENSPEEKSEGEHVTTRKSSAVGSTSSSESVKPGSGSASVTAPPRRRPPVTVTAKSAQAGLRASVQIREIDPWSTLKLSSIISAALFFVWMVAVGTLYLILDFMNVWERLNSAFTEIIDDGAVGEIISAGQIFGWAAAIGFVNLILFTALLTLASFIYNLAADLVGGVEVTLADRD